MTAEQGQVARQLLREGLDWIGMTELSEEEEEKATEVQARIERLLEDVEGSRERVTLTEHHAAVLAAKAHHQRCLDEKDACRLAMDKALSFPMDRQTQKLRIRRFGIAYQQWEAAERAMHNAEALYMRALCEVEG